MTVVGFQDFWVVGSRFYYKRDDIGAAQQPWIDLGVIETANPTTEVERIELEDADGGLKTVVDEAVTKIDETYDITCSNLNPDNLALLFLSDPPTDFTQAATARPTALVQYAHVGRLLKLQDAAGTNLYSISAIAGIHTGTADADVSITDMSASGKTITFGVAQTFADGDPIIVTGTALTNIKNSRTYTVNGAQSSQTVIPVNEAPVADETSIAGAAIIGVSGGGSPAIFIPSDEQSAAVTQSDYTIVSLDRGLVKFDEDSTSFTADGNVTIHYSLAAVTGKKWNPQDARGEVKGDAIIIWGRGNNAEQTAREARVSITPNSANLQIDDYSSFVLTVKVISDLAEADPAGRMLQFKGSLPSSS